MQAGAAGDAAWAGVRRQYFYADTYYLPHAVLDGGEAAKAQQAAEREKFVVMQTEQMRRLKVVYSSAQSEAGKIINDAMKANGDALLHLRQIEAAREIAQTMGKSGNVSYLPGTANKKDGSGGANMLLRA